MCMLPLVCRFCPNPALGSTALSEVYIPPINIVAEKTARLVEDLTNTDLDATDRFRAIQVVLTRIQSRVNIINIDKRVKEQLKTDLPALDHLIEKGIDDFIEMQAVLGSGVDSLKKHTEYVLDDFLRILDGKNSLFGPERIGSANTKTEKMKILYDTYSDWMDADVKQILDHLLAAQETFENIKKKLQGIDGIYEEGKHAADRNLYDLEKGTLWRRIFGGDSYNIQEQKRAIDSLDDFIGHNALFLKNILHTITKIKEYKAEIKQLRATEISSGAFEITLKIYLEQIQGALLRLAKSKTNFQDKTDRRKRLEENEL